MRILIGTPTGNGMVTIPYMTSFIASIEGVAKINQEHFPQGGGFHLGLYTLTHESLISRGRNHLAQVALQGAWDKLMFIDSDAGWTVDQLMAVVTAPVDICAGTCPLKTYPISMNYLPFKNDEHYYKDAVRSAESLYAMRKGHGTPYIKVPFVGTAFMCIDTKVFKKLAETAAPYQYPNPSTGQLETHWDFFKTNPVNKMYMSEDWGFCHMARECGFDIHIHADVIITHTGNHTFRAPPPPKEEDPSSVAPPVKLETGTAVQGEVIETNPQIEMKLEVVT